MAIRETNDALNDEYRRTQDLYRLQARDALGVALADPTGGRMKQLGPLVAESCVTFGAIVRAHEFADQLFKAARDRVLTLLAMGAPRVTRVVLEEVDDYTDDWGLEKIFSYQVCLSDGEDFVIPPGGGEMALGEVLGEALTDLLGVEDPDISEGLNWGYEDAWARALGRVLGGGSYTPEAARSFVRAIELLGVGQPGEHEIVIYEIREAA